jgi:hypothetical protein
MLILDEAADAATADAVEIELGTVDNPPRLPRLPRVEFE